jgi:hypothetical protein
VNGHPMNGAAAPADPDKLPGTWADPQRLTELMETHDLLYSAMGMLPEAEQPLTTASVCDTQAVMVWQQHPTAGRRNEPAFFLWGRPLVVSS